MNEQQMRDAVREAVAEGIRDVLADPDAQSSFWGSAFEQLQQRMQQQTGRILLGGLWALVRKGLLFIALGLVVYSLGGWTALVKLWQAMNH